MTVASNTPFDQYSATNGQTVFNYTFEIVENTDLLVYQRADGSDPDDVADLLILTVDYTVTGVGADNGGTIVLVSGATLDDIITIKQNVPVERDTSFTPGGVLKAGDLNTEFDNQTLIAQLSRFNEQARMVRYWNSAVVIPLVDNIIPVLPPGTTWWKNEANDAIESYILPEGGAAPLLGTFVTILDQTGLMPNSFPLDAIGSAFMVNRVLTGDIVARTFQGTGDQIDITNPAGQAGNPVWKIADNPIMPGSGGMGIPSGTTAQRVTPTPPNIGMRFNTDLGFIEAYISGSWVEIPSSAAGLFLPLAGGTMGGAIDMDLNYIHNLASPAADDDAATKEYVDTAVGDAAGGITGNMQWNNAGNFAGDPNFNTDGSGNIEIDGSLMVDNLLMDGNRISPLAGAFEIESGQLANDLDANTHKVINLGSPSSPNDAATKAYVDAIAAGLFFVDPVRVATTANIPCTYNNGASGVGATITVTALGAAAIDGVTLALNDRVLFKNQSTTTQNGIYVVSDIGSGGTSAVYTRATDYDEPSDIDPGDFVIVRAGTLNAGSGWIEASTVTAIGTDPITFVAFLLSLPVSLVNGGTGASLTASNGGIVYSNATTMAILAGTATARQMLQSGASGAPAWSTTTWPATTTVNRILFSSATNVIGEISTLASAGLLTDGSGIPGFVAYTGTGAPVLANTPTLITPILGVASATSLNFGSSTAGIIGTTTNNSANTGSVGEFVSSNIPVASSVGMSLNTATNLTSISLTAGDWSVGGNVRITGTAQAVTRTICWISTTSATLPNLSNSTEFDGNVATFLTGGGTVPITRISISGTTTVYISGQTTFGSGTASMSGNIWARRLR